MTREKISPLSTFMNPNQIQQKRGNNWYFHYYNYLCSLTYQLFEWEGLPPSIDPRYLEICLHQLGYVGFYKDPIKNYIVTQGTSKGMIDHYMLPTEFQANSVNYHESFNVYNYTDMDLTEFERENYGVVIFNNDLHFPTLPSIEMFASDLTELKEIIHVNQNAQKTPYFIATNDRKKLSALNIYNQMEGNATAIVVDEEFDMEKSIKVFSTNAPYVVDKLTTQRTHVWNEVMTFLGIKNANVEKRERMITDEVESNNEQIEASANIFLKARQEACDRINTLYPELNVSVKIRDSIVNEFNMQTKTFGVGDSNE